MLRTLALVAFAAAPHATQAQQQQAGAATDTDAAFQALIDACDDIDALMLRARIRLQLPRTTDEAAATAQQMLDEGFATCGSGDLDAAKAQLTEALAIAEAGATEVFGTDGSVAAQPTAEPEPEVNTEADEGETRPWWKIW